MTKRTQKKRPGQTIRGVSLPVAVDDMLAEMAAYFRLSKSAVVRALITQEYEGDFARQKAQEDQDDAK